MSRPGTLWIGGQLRSPFTIQEPEPYRPDLVLWFDATNDKILVADVLGPGEPQTRFTEYVDRALQQKAGKPPAVVRVATPEAAELVRGALPPGTTVEVGPTPELDRILEMMGRDLPGSEPHDHTYLGRGDVAPESVACLFREAAALYRVAPWSLLDDDGLLEVDVPELGISGATVSVIGSLGQSFGFLMFESYDDYDEFSGAAEGHEERGEWSGMDAAYHALNFERGADVPDDLRREIAAHGWPMAGAKAYPVLWAVLPGEVLRPLSEWDVRATCAAAAGIAALFKAHGRAIRAGDETPVSETIAVATPAPVSVTTRYPHPVHAGETGAVFETDAEAEKAMAPAVERVSRFLESPAVAAMPKAWRSDARFVCECLYEFRVGYFDGRVDGLAARHVEEFLLDFYPRKMGTTAATAKRTPEILDRFFAWLGEQGIEPDRTVARLRTRVARVREEFLEAATDPASFGPAKQFAMAMKAEGVDVTDPNEVKSFIAGYNAKLELEASLRGMAALVEGESSGKRARRRAGATSRSAKAGAGAGPAPRGSKSATATAAAGEVTRRLRWEPAPGDAAPSGDAPCPCGSGRRYRRCCMPR